MKHTFAFALLLLTLSSCGDKHEGHDMGAVGAGGHGGDQIGCREDPRAMMYSANLEQMGNGGRLRFVLVSSDPAPPIKGNNDWVVKVLDGAGAPVTGATISIRPFMPDHGHGTSVVPTITPMADAYQIQKVNLFMAGLWEVTVTASGGSASDFAKFSFCIEG